MERLQFISQETPWVTHLEGIRMACEAGVKWVQLRMKNESADKVLNTALIAKEICGEWGAKLTINDYPVVARETGAYGLHLGKDDMPLRKAREIAGDMVLGGTANTLEDIRQHVESGADYVGVGPFRFTTTKKKLSPILGLDGYYQILKNCRKHGINIPILAIGGLKLEDIGDLVETGVYGVAVSSLIVQASDRKKMVEEINRILNRKTFD